jgi:tripartite ATP-independent transporter DctM subunit
MSDVGIAGLMLALTFTAILFGVHIGISLLIFSLLGTILVTGDLGATAALLGTGPFYVLFEYELVVIPLFILMGDFVIMAGASQDLYDAFHVWLRKVRGGLAVATVLANAVFAAVTGVSIASAAVFSKVALPQMINFGYEKKFTLGTVAGSSVLGMLIPPSVLFIVYGIFSEESIGKLFMAGVIPGLILTVIYCVGISVMIRVRPELAGRTASNEKLGRWGKLRAIRETWGVLSLIVVVLGGMYGGILTPTEAGAAGAIGSFLLAIVRGRFKAANMRHALHETGLVTASFFLLFIGAQLFSRMLAVTGFVRVLTEVLVSLPVHPMVIILLMVIVWLILGCLIDSISIMILTLPLMLPVVKALGFNLIWFGVVATITIEMGLITPPFGMVVFVMKSTIGEGVAVEDIFKGTLPFLLMMVMALAIVIAFPALSTWLPAHM